MKKSEIHAGSVYFANVSGKRVQVRVDGIRDIPSYRSSTSNHRVAARTVYDVTNLTTGRKLTFNSAMRFQAVANPGTGPQAVANPAPATDAEEDSPLYQDPHVLADVTADDIRTIAQPVTVADQLRRQEQQVARPRPRAASARLSVNPTPSLGDYIRARREAEAPVIPGITPAVSPPHLIILARAGTGKTTTLVAGLQVMRGQAPTDAHGNVLTPSPQQAAVWDAMALSRGARSVCFVAFNTGIAEELRLRVPKGCDAMTLHSLGNRAVRAAFPGLGDPNKWRVANIIERLTGVDSKKMRADDPVLLEATRSLVGLCKLNLLGYCPETARVDPARITDEDLDGLCRHYEVQLHNGDRYGRGATKDYREQVYGLVRPVLTASLDVGRDRQIDFDDMVWLPTALGLPLRRYDDLLVDEAQDLNRAQHALARAAGRRLIFCGDDRQAIYGFTGADVAMLARLTEELGATPEGVVQLPLTVTRRCGRAIVDEARNIVDDFEAHESNGPGEVTEAQYTSRLVPGRPQGEREEYEDVPVAETYLPLVRDGDMVLCRVNGPLVSQCFKFLRMGRKAHIQGRDVGNGLVTLIESLAPASVTDLIGSLTDWAHKEIEHEQAKREPNENKIINIGDRRDCILAFCQGQSTVRGVVDRIKELFTDDRRGPGIKLSSIHKSKGLEARQVFLLMPRGGECPHPMARSDWQREQESNLLYVAITRAIERLIYVFP